MIHEQNISTTQLLQLWIRSRWVQQCMPLKCMCDPLVCPVYSDILPQLFYLIVSSNLIMKYYWLQPWWGCLYLALFDTWLVSSHTSSWNLSLDSFWCKLCGPCCCLNPSISFVSYFLGLSAQGCHEFLPSVVLKHHQLTKVNIWRCLGWSEVDI